ncbi:MAG: calcium/sodium antiporter [Clostridiales bacterium]|nr:calcium/sodium antiporter [Clostridiales bacterium]
MSTVWIVLLFVVGLILIIKGGDWFVDAAVWIAKVSGIPQFIIGATIVSLATTLPELMVSIMGTLDGEVDLAVGNAVGSVTANLGLIMGISIVCIPSVVRKAQFNLKALLMAGAAILLWVLCRGGNLAILPSALLLVIFAVFVWANVRDARLGVTEAEHPAHKRERPTKRHITINVAKFAVGVAAIIVGSNLLIDNGSALAEAMGVPSAIIGVTMVAIGTSLPELVTTITAIAKKEASMSIGNIVGANVIDLTLILPICSLISGGSLTIGTQSSVLDMPACAIVALLAVLPPLFKGKFYRWQGIVMLLFYVAYMVVLVTQFGV